MSDKMKATAHALVEHCRNGTEMTGLDTLYHPDAVSVEAMAMPGVGSAVSNGVAEIKTKHEWWNSAVELHEASVTGPYYHGDDRFGLIFAMETTDKASGQRRKGQELAIYTTDSDGRIIREEFFYETGDGA